MAITETQQGWARISADGLTIQKRTATEPNLVKTPGQPYWLPAFEVVDDQSSGTLPTNTVVGPVVIEVDRVSVTKTITDRSQQEIDDDIDADITELASSNTGQLINDLNNRVRVLEEVPSPLTREQYEQWIRSIVA